jgi:hypothetical protein
MRVGFRFTPDGDRCADIADRQLGANKWKSLPFTFSLRPSLLDASPLTEDRRSRQRSSSRGNEAAHSLAYRDDFRSLGRSGPP